MMRRAVPLIALVVVTNLVMLGSVRANRAGAPDALIRLTERELRVERSTERDSALRLWLSAGGNEDEPWLDGSRLAALGFECSLPASDESAPSFYARQLPRKVFGVYEFDGPAWQHHAQRLEARRLAVGDDRRPHVPAGAAALVDSALSGGTRLLAVDVGLDAASLRRAHPDSQRYLILPAVLTATVRSFDENGRQVAPALQGRMIAVKTELLVTRDLRRVVDQLPGSAGASRWSDVPPRYDATVAVGRRYEPWVTSIEPFDTPSTPH